MQDQEIKELMEDLSSIGLSSDPQFLTVGEEGIVEITRSFGTTDRNLNEFPLIKRMDLDLYRRGEVLVFKRHGHGTLGLSYFVGFETEEKAKQALIRVSSFLNS